MSCGREVETTLQTQLADVWPDYQSVYQSPGKKISHKILTASSAIFPVQRSLCFIQFLDHSIL